MFNWEYALFLIGAAAALGAALYFAMRAEQPPPPVKKRENKEPSFASRKPSAPQEAAAETETPPAAPAAASAETPAGKPPAALNPRKPQGTLPMENFTPPELPEPSESMLPLEMCYAARLYGRDKTAPAGLAALLQEMRPANAKNTYLLGFDSDAKQWRMPPDMPCRDWILAVPLADRGGALDNEDIRRMEEGARAFAEKAKMHPVFPAPFEALENAGRIDRFCAAADIFIELRLSGAERPAARIGEVMRLVGMSGNGRGYVRRANSEELFRGRVAPVPASGNARQIIVFEMDAPNISDPPRAFQEMMRAVRRAADMLDMRVTDPKGADIDERREADMCQKLSLLAAQMREFGAPPGGAIARLIFS